MKINKIMEKIMKKESGGALLDLLIFLLLVIVVILALSYFGFTFSTLIDDIKKFFGFFALVMT